MPRLSCSSDAGGGGAPTIVYTLGELARLLGVEVDRVEQWARNGWLVAIGGGHGPGRPRTFTQDELEIARRVLRIARRYGVTATAAMFAESRRIRAREA